MSSPDHIEMMRQLELSEDRLMIILDSLKFHKDPVVQTVGLISANNIVRSLRDVKTTLFARGT